MNNRGSSVNENNSENKLVINNNGNSLSRNNSENSTDFNNSGISKGKIITGTKEISTKTVAM